MIARRFACAALVLVGLAATACKPPETSQVEQHLVFTAPASWDFGQVPLGGTGMPVQVVVGVADEPDEYHSILSISESCDDFSLDLSAISFPADIYRSCDLDMMICDSQTQYFFVSFSPSVSGPQSCTITIEMNDGTQEFTVNGTGLPPPYVLTLLSPLSTTMAFGDVIVGQTSAGLPITVRGDGTEIVDIAAAALTAGGVVNYSITNGGATTVLPGALHTITVQCAPQAAGPANDAFRIDSNAVGSPIIVDLTCNGVVSDLLISPSPAQMSEVLVGESTFIDLSLSNVGGAVMTIDATTLSSGAFNLVSISGSTIPANGTITARVGFTATAALVDQDVSSTFTVQYNGGQSRTVDIIAPVRSAEVSVNPGGLVDFGTVCGGQMASRVFAAVNLGTGAMELASASVAGTGFRFTLQPGSYPAPLTPRAGNSLAFEVTADPPLGEATGTLTLYPTDAVIPPTVIGLRATGQADGIAAAPTSIALDSVAVGMSSGGRTVRLTNCEPGALSVARVTLGGPDAAEFSVLSELVVPGSIPAYGSATWLVELTPDDVGEKSATLDIVYAGGRVSIPLSGAGVEFDLPEDDEGRGTYYACNAGDGAGLWPLLLALVALLARRSYRPA